jgi:hypothetical protein
MLIFIIKRKVKHSHLLHMLNVILILLCNRAQLIKDIFYNSLHITVTPRFTNNKKMQPKQ